MPPLGTPLAHTTFNLNTAGVAGFFGGEEAISAMHTVHLYEGRRWLGWFNSPGSYTIAKCFGRMANSRFWDGLFPGPNDSPAVSFGLDGKKGPRYIAALSGTNLMNTQHLAYLVMEWSKELTPEKIEGRKTAPVYVTYLAMKHVNYEASVERLPLKKALLGLIPISASVVACIMCALVYDWLSFSMILFGIISSGWASVVVGEGKLVIESVKEPASGAPSGHGVLIGEDGVVVIKGKERDVNAITKGRFVLETDTRKGDVKKKRGEGNILDEANRQRNEGNEHVDAANPHDDREKEQGGAGKKPEMQMREADEKHETRNADEKAGGQEKKQGEGSNSDEASRQRNEGNEQVDAGNPHGDQEKGQSGAGKKLKTQMEKQADEKHSYHEIGICSLVLLVQFLFQLLLIPQGTLFGQIMFLASLGISWAYNSYLSSLEKEKIQAEILLQTLGKPEMRCFRAGTRTTMTVFVCLLLFHKVTGLSLEKGNELRAKILHECIPNDTDVWKLWKKKVVQQLLNIDKEGSGDLPYLTQNEKLSEEEGRLLKVLLGDARAAFNKYLHVREELPDDSTFHKG